MISLPASSFDIIWSLDPVDYPVVFLVDIIWADTKKYSFQPGSQKNKELTGLTPLSHPSQYIHGEQTRLVVQSVARGLQNERIILVSMERVVLMPGIEPPKNLLQALSRVVDQVKSGDLVVINIGPKGGEDSYAHDESVGPYLQDITDSHGGIVVISAGNSVDELDATVVINSIVVGGISKTGMAQSRYGENVTCYGVVPYDLPGYPGIQFGRSSAATAYTAGMVLMMLNYAKSKGHTLTSKQIVDLLKSNGRTFKVITGTGTDPDGILPDWDLLKQALDKLGN